MQVNSRNGAAYWSKFPSLSGTEINRKIVVKTTATKIPGK